MESEPKSHDATNMAANVIRPLGHLESFQSALYLLGLYRSTIVTCRYNIPGEFVDESAQEQLRDKIEQAIAAAVLQHPFLQVGIIDEDSKGPRWVQLETINLAHHIQWQLQIEGSEEEYQSLYNSNLREQLDTKFSNPRTRPAWRIVVLRSKGKPSHLDLMFVWNHSIADGMSGKIFQETLLGHLNHPASVTERPLLQNHILRLTATAERLPPPMDKLANFPVSLAFAAATAWEELKPSFLAGDSTKATWAPIRSEPYETTQRVISLDNSTLQNILSSCRQNKTSFTGLLHAAVLISLAVQLMEKEAPAFASITALNLRRHIPSTSASRLEFDIDQTIGNFVSRQVHKFDKTFVRKIRDLAAKCRESTTPSERNGEPNLQELAGTEALRDVLWVVAARVRGEIQERLDLGLKNDIVGLMGLVRDWRSQMKQELKKPRAVAWNVTNLGVMDGKLGGTEIVQAQDANNDNMPNGVSDPKGWSVSRAVFSLSADVTEAFIHISPMAVKGGDLTIEVSWQRGLIDDTICERLTDGVREWLRSIGQA
ncbi:alcohol acetyltransferase domain-containing protein [Trichoderma evansii]